METSKTYVFNPEGSGNNGGMMSLIAPLLQQRGVDPNVLLAMKGNNGFGNGDGSWFIWLLFILCFCGWGGNGFGFGGRGNGAGLANEINNDYGRSLLMDAIGGNRNALSNLATQLNCTEGQIQQAISALTTQVQNVGNQVGMSGMQTINALQQGNMQIASQLADCCCRVNNNITAMDGNVKLAMCQQTGTLQCKLQIRKTSWFLKAVKLWMRKLRLCIGILRRLWKASHTTKRLWKSAQRCVPY